MTGMDLIQSALRLINVLASGETPTGDESSNALLVINQLIDGWNAERLMIFSVQRTLFNLVANQQTYTFGTGGNFNAARPAAIERGGIIVGGLETQLLKMSEKQWAELSNKAQTAASPTQFYDDAAYPLRNVSFWPVPTTAPQTALYTWTALTQFPDLVTDETFPPGYAKALRYNAAVDLAREYGREVPPEVAAIAQQLKASIQSLNALRLPGGHGTAQRPGPQRDYQGV